MSHKSLCRWPVLLALCGWLTGCGRADTLYSPPGDLSSTNAPAGRLILPADDSQFAAHTDIRLLALATPHGTDLGPLKPSELPFAVTPKYSKDWELVQDPEDSYTVEFFAGATSLGARPAGEISARAKQIPGRAIPLIMPVIGYPAVELVWSNAPPGQYTLTARVTNQRGLTTISAPVTITVK